MASYSQLLPYESNLLVELTDEDGLLIMAKGLGVDRLLLNLLRPFCSPETLVFVLNTTEEEQVFITEQITALSTKHPPTAITSETTSTMEREKLYLGGGVFFITTRILVVDMLAKRVPLEYVTGIVVNRAHKIGESSQEAFILRMFREGNEHGFIKGFSDAPYAFMRGFAQVERVMKQLFVRKLFLWPRFHVDVNEALEQHKPDVVELSVELTPLMTTIQLSLLDLISCCLKELKKVATFLPEDFITLDNALTASFDKDLHVHMEPQWNQLPNKTKQLTSDVKILRTLLVYLVQYDSVTFYTFLVTLRANESYWLFLESAHALFTSAKERAYGGSGAKTQVGKKSKEKKDQPDDDDSTSDKPNHMPETSPKWEALKQMLDEIKTECGGKDAQEKTGGKILVCASDERTCHQLRQLLCTGTENFLKYLVEKNELNREINRNKKQADTIRKRKFEEDMLKKKREFAVDAIDDRFTVTVLPDPVVVIHPLSGHDDHYGLLRKLYELQPKYVILYDARMEFVRQLEVYKASQPGVPLRVYFMFYNTSVEEQRYLTTLRMENEAFEVLIQQKSRMVIPKEREGKGEVAVGLIRDKIVAPPPDPSSRKAGGRQVVKTANKIVVVDMREFRSDLPSLIHKRGMEIVPVTLEVGDYILSPELCVERKSVSDLIGSLNNGRLYSQCVAMTRYYKQPVLLIEFDDSKSFSLQAQQSLGKEVSAQNVSSKLALLTIHFPNLRIIWSLNAHLTADIFEELKQSAKEPDPKTAATIGLDKEETSGFCQFNVVPTDLVLKMPGMTVKNYRRVLHKFDSLVDLANRSEEEIAEVIEHKDFAKKFCQFLEKKSQDLPPLVAKVAKKKKEK